MGPRYYFGIYHWRRRFRRLAVGLAVVALGTLLWRRRDGRLGRLIAVAVATLGAWRVRRPVRRLIDPPPWRLRRYKYDALAADLPLADADQVLDLGTGTGRSLVGLAPHVWDGAEVTAIDVFDDRIILGNGPRLATSNASTAGLEAVAVAGDAARLPVGDDTQDVVTACRLLHDLPREDAVATLAEARRVLRPGGHLGVLELPIPHEADADPLAYWRDLVADAGFSVATTREIRRGDARHVVVTATPDQE